MTDWRRAKVLRNGEWHDIPFEEIKEGDTVRLFESDGAEFVMDGGGTVAKALSDAEPLPEPPGNYGVELQPAWKPGTKEYRKEGWDGHCMI